MNVAKVVLALVLSFAGLAGTGQSFKTAPFEEDFEYLPFGISYWSYPVMDTTWFYHRDSTRAIKAWGLNTVGGYYGQSTVSYFFDSTGAYGGKHQQDWINLGDIYNQNQTVFRLRTPYLILNTLSKPTLSFDYHLFGKDIKKVLVKVRPFGSTTDILLDSIVGQTHKSPYHYFRKHSVSLNGFSDTLMVIFEAKTTTGPNRIVALDNISVTEEIFVPLYYPQSISYNNNKTCTLHFDKRMNRQFSLQSINHSKRDKNGLVNNVVGDSLTLTNGTPGALYNLYFRQFTNTDSSVWSNPILLQFPCENYIETFPFSENFDTWMADTLAQYDYRYAPTFFGQTNKCWENKQEFKRGYSVFKTVSGSILGLTPAYDYPADYTGDFSLSVFKHQYNSLGNKPTIYSPRVDLSAAVNPIFSYKLHSHTGSNKLKVFVKSKTSLQLLDSIVAPLQTNKQEPWITFQADLSTHKNDTIQIVFEQKNATYPISIDDFSIREKPGCALAGLDRTILLCDTASQIQNGRYSLSNLLDSNAVGGTWVDVSGSGALNGNLVVLNQLLADTLYRYQYQIPASVGCAADTMEVRLQLVASACLISLAEQINQGAIQVFPNPNKGIFNVEFGQAVHNPVFTLHQLSGKSLAVQAVKLSENAYQLSTKNIPAGVYFISIQGDKKEILARKKVVIGE